MKIRNEQAFVFATGFALAKNAKLMNEVKWIGL